MTEFVSATADIRGDYRYSLTRVWDEALPTITFVLLNPSTADAQKLDQTMRRCVSFAKRQGFGGMVIVNLYAFRSTSPKVMKAAADPVGPENDRVLAAVTGTVVAGWGNHADPARVAQVVALLPPLYALGINKGGQPTHPLYVLDDAPLIEWMP
ncbi:DUF1643 domain-containing protein [Agromyces sp. GXQ0307]|uniref:DUF1643 domain-containing protein n=1 Tax=Agromyces sp. GXQ0307 TaxID=3377835 RepID=UPI00383BC56A